MDFFRIIETRPKFLEIRSLLKTLSFFYFFFFIMQKNDTAASAGGGKASQVRK